MEKRATAMLEARSGSSVAGTGTFSESSGRVTLVLALQNAPPGVSAVHLHEKGDCSAPDASSAGPHWSPSEQPHGHPTAAAHHLGDVGNLEVGADGTGILTFSAEDWELGTGSANDVLGRALIVHQKQDDFTSQPAGNAGGRIACGVVKMD